MRGIQRGITTTFIVFVILAGTIAITAVYLNYFQTQKQKTSEITSFEDCAKHYPVMESYTEQCATPDGKQFTKKLSTEENQRLAPSFKPSAKPSATVIEIPADWKTYTREKEFEYSYPPNWVINEIIPPQGFSNVGDPKASYPDGYLTVEKEFSRTDCSREEKEISQGYIQKDLRQSDLILNAVQAKAFEGITLKETEEYQRKIILIYNNGACFKLDYSSNNLNQKSILDKIVSSFKVLN